jgi:hypothetical protein
MSLSYVLRVIMHTVMSLADFIEIEGSFPSLSRSRVPSLQFFQLDSPPCPHLEQRLRGLPKG